MAELEKRLTLALPIILASELIFESRASALLGTGGFGCVQRATWKQKQVAVKTFKLHQFPAKPNSGSRSKNEQPSFSALPTSFG